MEQSTAKKVYGQQAIPRDTLTDRVRPVVQSTFNGRRIVIFSGGERKGDDNAVLDEARSIREGGDFGSIIGRNVFQRKKEQAIQLLDGMMQIYA